jgi:hypothetical protein
LIFFRIGGKSISKIIFFSPIVHLLATSDSDVESPYELERMSIYVTRMERESRLGTLDRGPYPLEIQPPTLVDDPIL